MPDGDVQTIAAQTASERGCGSTKRPSSMLVAAVVGALRVMAAGYLPLRGIMQREARHERVATVKSHLHGGRVYDDRETWANGIRPRRTK